MATHVYGWARVGVLYVMCAHVDEPRVHTLAMDPLYEPPEIASSDGPVGRQSWRLNGKTCVRALLVACVAAGVAVGIYYAVKASESSSSSSAGVLPQVKPPVAAATPAGLKAGLSGLSGHARHGPSLAALDWTAVKQRFFSETGGPTQLFGLLASVDSRIASINTRLSQFPALGLENSTVAVDIYTWGATNTTLYVQCADAWSGPNASTGFNLFGTLNDTFYLYENGPETQMAAVVTLDGAVNATRNATRVEIWYSVGLTAPYNGSHGVVHLLALPGAAPVFEMTMAGQGIGYCGVHLRADATAMYVIGSEGGGTNCASTDTVCTAANDTSVSATCGSGVTTFSLVSLGVKVNSTGPNNDTYVGSHFPGGANNTVRLSGDGLDDTRFGPRTIPLALQ